MRKLFISLLLLCALLAPVMGARSFNGTSDAMSAASVDLSGVNKITLVFWLYWDSFTNNDDLAMEFTANFSASTGGFYLDPNSSTSGTFELGLKGDVGIYSGHFPRPSAAAWHHYAIVFDKSQTVEIGAVYVDGASQTVTPISTNDNTNNFASSTLYFMSRNASTLFGAGRMADAAIYPGIVFSADDINALAKGASPRMVRLTAKPYYWSILGRASPEPELFYGATAALTGTSQVEHPRIFYPHTSR